MKRTTKPAAKAAMDVVETTTVNTSNTTEKKVENKAAENTTTEKEGEVIYNVCKKVMKGNKPEVIQPQIENESRDMVVKGNKANKLREKLYKYVDQQIAAAVAASTINQLCVSIADIQDSFKLYLKNEENELTNKVSAKSYDIHADLLDVCYTISCELIKNKAARIPVLKSRPKSFVLTTVKSEYFNQYYSESEKAVEKSKKAKAAAAERKAKKEEEAAAAEREKNANTIAIDNADKATLAIMELIAKYGNSLDVVAIMHALDTTLKSANINEEEEKAVVIA